MSFRKIKTTPVGAGVVYDFTAGSGIQVQMALMGALHSLVWLAAAMAQTRKVFMEPDTKPVTTVLFSARRRLRKSASVLDLVVI